MTFSCIPPILRGLLLFVVIMSGLPSAGWGRSNLAVKDIRVGSQGAHTRLALILSRSSKLYVREDREHRLIKIEAPEDTLWQIPSHSQQSTGMFEKYTLFTNNEGVGVCMVSLKPYAVINDKGLKKIQEGYEYFIDIIEKAPPPPPPPPPPAVTVQPVIEIKQTIEQEAPRNPIQKVDMTLRNPSTTWLIIRSAQKTFFDFQNMMKDGALLVYLPKTDWAKVPLTNQATGMINNVVVDDDNPKQSTLMLMSSGPKDVIDQFISTNQDGSFDCVLVIANRMASPIEIHRLLQKKLEYQEQVPSPRVMETTVETPIIQVKPEEKMGKTPPTKGKMSADNTDTFAEDAPIRKLETELEEDKPSTPDSKAMSPKADSPTIDAPIRQLEEELDVDKNPGAPSSDVQKVRGEIADVSESNFTSTKGELPPPQWTENADVLSPEAK